MNILRNTKLIKVFMIQYIYTITFVIMLLTMYKEKNHSTFIRNVFTVYMKFIIFMNSFFGHCMLP